MRFDADFRKMIFDGYVTVTVNVLYFMPDHRSILNEFIWSTLDLTPRYPRVKRFLEYWESNIDGKIKKVTLFDSPHLDAKEWRNGFIISFDN